MSDIFREVDEELREERLKKAWKRFGPFVVVLALVAVAVTGGTVFWRNYQEQQRQTESDRYFTALEALQAGDEAKALSQFAELSSNADGYGLLAELQLAALQAGNGDAEAAAETYRSLADDVDAPVPFRDLASLLLARLEIESGDPADLSARLDPLTAAGSPWRFLARELQVALALRQGDLVTARTLASELSSAGEVPNALRQRMTELSAALGPAE